jgi:hypothetical protein
MELVDVGRDFLELGEEGFQFGDGFGVGHGAKVRFRLSKRPALKKRYLSIMSVPTVPIPVLVEPELILNQRSWTLEEYEAMITAGGADVKEFDPKTMRSRIIDNLFLAGEIFDLDGPTGGYNLQICWSTGYVVGSSVILKL